MRATESCNCQCRLSSLSTGVILRAIEHRLVEETGEPRETNWFRQ